MNNTIKYLNKKWSVYETETDNITWKIGSGVFSPTGPTILPVTTNRVTHFDGSNTSFSTFNIGKVSNYNNISISKNLNTNITQSLDLKTVDDINIVTSGGLNINTHADRSLDLIGNTCIKHIKSMIPNIITTQLLSEAGSITNNSDENAGQYILDPLKTVNIVSITDYNNIISTNYNTSDVFMRIKLQPGKYNGQICKIVLHPDFENTLDIEARTNSGYLQEVILRIDSFVDTNTNEFVSADLILNRGGMSINLIYVATNTNTDSLLTNDTKPYSALTNDPNNDDDQNNDQDDRGYWMLIDNNFNTTD